MKKFGNFLIILFVIYLSWINATSRFLKSPFEVINTETGLSQNSVSCICQDNRGFIWFGTNDGLNRFDGFEFKLLKFSPEKPNSLPSSNIYCLYSNDSENYIWVGTGNGLCRVNTYTFETKTFTPKLTKSKQWSVKAITGDNNTLWIGSSNGLYAFDKQSHILTKIPLVKNIANSAEPISKITLDKYGNLLIGTSGLGLFIKEKGSDNCKAISLIRKKVIYIEDYYVYDMCKTQNGTIYIATERSCFVFNPESKKTIPQKQLSSYLENNPALTILEKNNHLLLGVYQVGLIKFDKKTQKIENFIKHYPEQDFFETNDIYTLFKDKSGIVWIGTDGAGVIKLYDRKIHFGNYSVEKNGVCVMAIEEENNNNLWVGSYGKGLYKLNLTTGIEKHITSNTNNHLKLSGNIILALYKDKTNKLWIGTMNNGVTLYDLNKEKVSFYKYRHFDYNTVGDNMITCFFEDNNKNIWIGTGYGISLFIKDKKIFKHLYSNEFDKNSLSANIINCISGTKDGHILVGTSGGGINILDDTGKVIKVYKHDKNDKNSLGYDYINCIYEDKNETLWISTSGMGFDKLEKGSNKFVHYREENGLPNNSVFSILEDDKGNLWMSTNKGITKFNKKTETFTNYDYRDGLQSNEFNGSAGLKLMSGKLAFGGIKGLNVFNPHNITKTTFKPITSITDIKLFNKSLINKNINWKTTKQINLTYKENTLSFDFICLDFAIPEKNQYKYMLKGVDKEPVLTTAKNRSVTYAGLPPGNYIFKVWGANSDGIWDKTGDFVKINITPPFWGTLWFRISAVIFFIIFSNLLFFAWKKLYVSYSYWRSTHIIGKRYKISDKIGSGGTGAVYKAYDKVSGKTVALKILDDKYLDEETTKRFSVEQSVYEKIKHTNTVEIYEKGNHGGKLYYVMEYIDGITLSNFAKSENLSENQILSIFAVLLDIVNEIHSYGVIHRDLKPDNIMICKNLQSSQIPENFHTTNDLKIVKENIKILDFGLAKILGSKTLTQSAIFGGTLYYFPPEFLFGKKIRETAFDFYSLGVVLYEMLTGSHLYNVEDSAELLAAVVSSSPAPPINKNSTISEQVSNFVMKIIAKQPENRLKNYHEIKEALQNLEKN